MLTNLISEFSSSSPRHLVWLGDMVGEHYVSCSSCTPASRDGAVVVQLIAQTGHGHDAPVWARRTGASLLALGRLSGQQDGEGTVPR